MTIAPQSVKSTLRAGAVEGLTPDSFKKEEVGSVQLPEHLQESVAVFMKSNPTQADNVIRNLMNRNIDIEFLGKYMPNDTIANARAFNKGAFTGLTLGLLDSGDDFRDPRVTEWEAPTINVPYIGEVGGKFSPHELGGNIVGGIPSGVAASVGGGKALAVGGVGKLLTSLMGKKAGATATQILGTGVGEGALGGTVGYINYDGDLKKAAEHAVIFGSLGILGEGTVRIVVGAVKKVKKGKSLTEEEHEAMSRFQKAKDKLKTGSDKFKQKFANELSTLKKVTGINALQNTLHAPVTYIKDITTFYGDMLQKLGRNSGDKPVDLEDFTQGFMSYSRGILADLSEESPDLSAKITERLRTHGEKIAHKVAYGDISPEEGERLIFQVFTRLDDEIDLDPETAFATMEIDAGSEWGDFKEAAVGIYKINKDYWKALDLAYKRNNARDAAAKVAREEQNLNPSNSVASASEGKTGLVERSLDDIEEDVTIPEADVQEAQATILTQAERDAAYKRKRESEGISIKQFFEEMNEAMEDVPHIKLRREKAEARGETVPTAKEMAEEMTEEVMKPYREELRDITDKALGIKREKGPSELSKDDYTVSDKEIEEMTDLLDQVKSPKTEKPPEAGAAVNVAQTTGAGITDTQYDLILKLERQLRDSGVSVQTLESTLSRMNLENGREHVVNLKRALGKIRNKNSREGFEATILNDVELKNEAPEALEFYLNPHSGDDAPLFWERAERIDSEGTGVTITREAEDVANSKKIVTPQEETTWGRFKESAKQFIKRAFPKQGDGIYKEPGLLWFWKVAPPSWRHGLSQNPLAKTRVIDTMNTMENIGRDTMEYLNRLKSVIAKLEGGEDNLTSRTGRAIRPAKAMLGSKVAKNDLTQAENLKSQLVELLDAPTAARRDQILALDESGLLRDSYIEIRQITDELADMLGLELNGRITEYFPHIFDGSVGSFRAKRIMNENNIYNAKRENQASRMKEVDNFNKNFSSVKERAGVSDDYSKDFDTIMYTYIRGAIEKRHMDPLVQRMSNSVRALKKQSRVISRERGVDAKGNPIVEQIKVTGGKKLKERQSTSDELAKWFKYVIGHPSDWKMKQAIWWRNNETFNRWVDNLVGWLGDAEDKTLLERGRTLNFNPDPEIEVGGKFGRMSILDPEAFKKRQVFIQVEEEKLTTFFDGLIKQADEYERGNGITPKEDLNKIKQYRAHLALMVDDIRAGLQDPARKPLILESLYGVMVLNKLGFSVSHGLINTTQFLATTVPSLGLRYSAKGIGYYSQQGNIAKKIGNKSIDDIVEESGVKAAFYESTEFTGRQSTTSGIWKIIDETGMLPATLSEDFLRVSTLLGTYAKEVDLGASHGDALGQAKAMVKKTQFVYDRTGAPSLFHSPFLRFLLMFKTYPIHMMAFSSDLLEDAIRNGQWGPLGKHILAYLTMAGAGATVLGGTRFGDLTEHPIVDVPKSVSSYGVPALGGPPASSLIEILHGNLEAGASEWTETVAGQRFGRAIESGNPLDLTGLTY